MPAKKTVVTLRLILADAQTLMRAGLRLLVERIADVEVIAEAGDAPTLLRLLEQHKPDLVITNFGLFGSAGLESIEQVRQHFPAVPLLVCCAPTEAGLIRGALKLGISGVLTRDAEVLELEVAIRAALKGQSYFSPSVSRVAMDQRRLGRAEERPLLTPRQREVMRYLARGRTTKEIAAIMGLGIKTVETHRARLMETLRVKTSNALIHYAIRHGFDGGSSS